MSFLLFTRAYPSSSPRSKLSDPAVCFASNSEVNSTNGATAHCLDLVLNGLLTRRNFWHIPGMLGNYTIPKWKEFLKLREPILRKSYLSTFIHIKKHKDGARGTLWKNHNRLLFTTSNEYNYPKIFLIFMHGYKSASLAIFQNFQKLPKWHFFTHAWKPKFFWAKCLYLKW